MKPDNNNYNWSEKTILIVEDTDTSIMYYRAALKKSKVKLVCAENGLQAVELVKQGRHFDLILMDINMPLLNGIEATKQIKSINPKIPVIVQTAYVLNDERIKSFEAGCDGFMAKPVKIQQLFDTIESLL
ncbi:MAG: response regulator [Marinilabiliales bacterium]|nr:MAG: response regulator [Marinilabiliales bacterium]